LTAVVLAQLQLPTMAHCLVLAVVLVRLVVMLLKRQ
jgi:hypothetical protein